MFGYLTFKQLHISRSTVKISKEDNGMGMESQVNGQTKGPNSKMKAAHRERDFNNQLNEEDNKNDQELYSTKTK